MRTTAQEPTASIQTTVQLVTMDIIVTDKSGAVHGLTCADFHLMEEKRPQQLDRCEEHRAPAKPMVSTAPIGRPNTFTNAQTVIAQAPVYDIVLLDYLNSWSIHPAKLREVSRSLLGLHAAGHNIAVFALGDRMALLSGFTDDLAKLDHGGKALPKSGAGLAEPEAFSRSDAEDLNIDLFATTVTVPGLVKSVQALAANARTRTTVSALHTVAVMAGMLPGRKNLLWVTATIPNMFQQDDNRLSFQNVMPQFEAVSRELARERVAIYPIDLRGVTDDVMIDASTHGPGVARPDLNRIMDEQADQRQDVARNARAVLDSVAAETGGRAFHGNDFSGEARQALDAGQEYYTVSYRPRPAPADGKFRSVTISVSRPNVHLGYRPGYLPNVKAGTLSGHGEDASTKEVKSASAETDRAAALAMERGMPPSRDILFAVEAHSHVGIQAAGQGQEAHENKKQHRMPVAQVDLKFLVNTEDLMWTVTPDAHVADLRITAYVYDNFGSAIVKQEHSVNLRFTADEWTANHKTTTFRLSLPVPVDRPSFLRFALRDLGSDRIGSLEFANGSLQPESEPSSPAHGSASVATDGTSQK